MWLNPWLGMGFVLLILLASMTALGGYARRLQVRPEAARKLLHVTMGMVALAFPWLFTADWPVVALAGFCLSFLGILRFRPSLRRSLGYSLYAVNRNSLGEFYFTGGIAITYLLWSGDPVNYCIPILILTFADAAAAIAGTRYGRMHFRIGGGEKTVAGSVAFLVTAFFTTYVVLMLAGHQAHTHGLTLALALAVALCTTLLEACTGHGLDNLAIPVGGLLALHYASESGAVLAVLAVACIGLLALVFRLANRALSTSGRTYGQAR